MSEAAPKPRKKPSGGSLKGEFFRQSRIWHGYLSAFAFAALMFFSITGLTLNHPEWFKPAAKEADRIVQLTPQQLAATRAATVPGMQAVKIIGGEAKLIGAYKSGEIIDNELMVRLESVKGSSDIVLNLDTGKAEITLARHDAVTVINELHRGKNAPGAWKLVIDLTAIIVLALSIIGYVLFFSLRFRLRTSLILTGVSVAALIAVFLFLTP